MRLPDSKAPKQSKSTQAETKLNSKAPKQSKSIRQSVNSERFVCYKCDREICNSKGVWICRDCTEQGLTHLSSRNYKEKEGLRGDKLCCVCGHKVKVTKRTKTICQTCSDSDFIQKDPKRKKELKNTNRETAQSREHMKLKQEKDELKRKKHSQSKIKDNNKRSASLSSSSNDFQQMLLNQEKGELKRRNRSSIESARVCVCPVYMRASHLRVLGS